MRLGFGILRSKLLPLRYSIGRGLWGYWGVMWRCFASSTVVTLTAVLWDIRRRRRRPVTSESDSLLLHVQDEDRKISQLLRQVAGMNEVLRRA